MACPIGSCPPEKSRYGAVYARKSLQGETRFDSGQGEMMLNLGLLVDKGGSAGPVIYGKLPLYVGVMQTAGGGTAWAMNANSIRNAIPGGRNSFGGMPGSGVPGKPGALGNVSTIGFENDLTNWDKDSAQSGAFIALYYGHFQGSFSSSAYFNLDAVMAGATYGAHYGMYWQKSSVKDITWMDASGSDTGMEFVGKHASSVFEDNSSGNVSLLLKGRKSMASIIDAGSANSSFNPTGSFRQATIEDKSTSPSFLEISGLHSSAAIKDSTETLSDNFFMAIKANHKVCLNGRSVCIYYSETEKMVVGTDPEGRRIWHIDDAGNAVFAGSVTPHGKP
ncbi:hypothetical protein [Swaminathania salitolerans]|uniref:hypothetical protein n=1 Tax=Swaminathania salitolerans TaxID=182838 RepID=UPI0011BFDBB6|nr:hypothetical protein [Swaminathania salitolerans]